jgi:hypothetical protein
VLLYETRARFGSSRWQLYSLAGASFPSALHLNAGSCPTLELLHDVADVPLSYLVNVRDISIVSNLVTFASAIVFFLLAAKTAYPSRAALV